MTTLMRRRAVRDEGGFALITVILGAMVTILLATAVVAYAEGSQNLSRHDQDWNAALAAAEAGIDDYLFRLNQNANYWQYSSSNPPPDGNQAFTTWVPVSGGSTEAEYRYAADASSLGADGRIRITSTGRVRNSERTVFATLRRRSFLDYLYFTDLETRDPALYTGGSSEFSSTEAGLRCNKYYYAGRDVQGRNDYVGDTDTKNCIDINFASADNINGPLHSNDAMLMCGSPNFNGDTSTSWDTSAPRYRVNGACSGGPPDFANPGDPANDTVLPMPPSNGEIKTETGPGLGGCLYTGPTRIRLRSNGTMDVRSPFSKVTNNAGCPKYGNVPLPTNGVIFVQNVPSVSSDPNYTNGCPYSVNGRSHPLGFPISGDQTQYECRKGDVFIEGTLDGQLTVAADNRVVVTGNTTYEGGVGGDDLLGLVANTYVEIYHPISSSGSDLNANLPPCYSSCTLGGLFTGEAQKNNQLEDVQLYAAVVSVTHSFWVQNYNKGNHNNLGDLNVVGAIAQKYRGTVGTISGSTIVTGYAKNYVYDQRLQYLSPPKFLPPVDAAWAVATWAELNQ